MLFLGEHPGMEGGEGMGSWSLLGPPPVDWISLCGLPSPLPLRGSRQSKTKEGINQKGRSFGTKD